MRANLLGGLLALGAVVAGCGHAPALMSLPVAGSQIASRQAATLPVEVLVIIRATTRETMANPGYRSTFTVGGKDGVTPFTLVVETYNPSSFFVSKLTAVTLNGKPLQDKASRTQWAERLLQGLKTAPQALHLTISQAANYLPLELWSGR
jgi:hypothetical protein